MLVAIASLISLECIAGFTVPPQKAPQETFRNLRYRQRACRPAVAAPHPARASAPIYGLKVCGPAKVQQMRQRERFIVDVDAFRSCGS